MDRILGDSRYSVLCDAFVSNLCSRFVVIQLVYLVFSFLSFSSSYFLLLLLLFFTGCMYVRKKLYILYMVAHKSQAVTHIVNCLFAFLKINILNCIKRPLSSFQHQNHKIRNEKQNFKIKIILIILTIFQFFLIFCYCTTLFINLTA